MMVGFREREGDGGGDWGKTNLVICGDVVWLLGCKGREKCMQRDGDCREEREGFGSSKD